MATVRSIERRIFRVEGFNVRILYDTGENVRSDRSGLPGYPYDRMLKNAANVHHWIESRFRHAYPGFDIEVLDARGRRVHGRTKLATVRDSYLD